jgi:hypothetical protein
VFVVRLGVRGFLCSGSCVGYGSLVFKQNTKSKAHNKNKHNNNKKQQKHTQRTHYQQQEQPIVIVSALC